MKTIALKFKRNVNFNPCEGVEITYTDLHGNTINLPKFVLRSLRSKKVCDAIYLQKPSYFQLEEWHSSETKFYSLYCFSSMSNNFILLSKFAHKK